MTVLAKTCSWWIEVRWSGMGASKMLAVQIRSKMKGKRDDGPPSQPMQQPQLICHVKGLSMGQMRVTEENEEEGGRRWRQQSAGRGVAAAWISALSSQSSAAAPQ